MLNVTHILCGWIFTMKAVQILLEEDLLVRLDQDRAVRHQGRSAVLRHIIKEYLDRQAREAITEQYRQAYGDQEGLGNEFAGWEDEGRWPEP